MSVRMGTIGCKFSGNTWFKNNQLKIWNQIIRILSYWDWFVWSGALTVGKNKQITPNRSQMWDFLHALISLMWPKWETGCETIHQRHMTSAHHGEELRAFLYLLSQVWWCQCGERERKKMASQRTIPHGGSWEHGAGVVSSLGPLWNYLSLSIAGKCRHACQDFLSKNCNKRVLSLIRMSWLSQF